MKTTFLKTIPVLPSQNIERDVLWYLEKVGFTAVYQDKLYAVLQRDQLYIHLQWHADTIDDPLLGGSVVRIQVDDIQPVFLEFLAKDIVTKAKLQLNTPWNTNEFGFYDINNNAIFIVEFL